MSTTDVLTVAGVVVAVAVATKAKTTVKLDLPQKLRDKLKKDGKLDLVLTALALDPARHRRTVTQPVMPKLKQ